MSATANPNPITNPPTPPPPDAMGVTEEAQWLIDAGPGLVRIGHMVNRQASRIAQLERALGHLRTRIRETGIRTDLERQYALVDIDNALRRTN